MAGLDDDGKLWEHRKYQTTLAKLRGALGQTLSWGEVDALRRFERHLRRVKGNNANTTQKELTRLRRVFKQAIRDGEIGPADDPFLVYEKPRGQAVHRRKLELAEVEALRDAGLGDGACPRRVRVGVLRRGMRFGDVCALRAGGGYEALIRLHARLEGLSSTPYLLHAVPPPRRTIEARSHSLL